MAYDPRTVAFVAEIFHPPALHDARRLQSLHNELFPDPRLGYRNFALVPGGASLANPVAQPGAASTATFLADRIQVREEGTGATLEEFCARVAVIGRLAVERLGVPIFIAQQATIRSLVNPRRERDSRLFLARDVLRLPDAASGKFGRAASLVGLRFVFPGTAEDPGTYNLRVESYNGDPRSLFVEAVGAFPPVVAASAAERLATSVQATYRFLTERALAFVESYEG